MAYVYFLFSEEQVQEKNQILAGMSKKFQPGVISIGNKKEKFSQISSSSTIPRFVDTKIVAEGEQDKFTYTMPQTVEMRGNNI